MPWDINTVLLQPSWVVSVPWRIAHSHAAHLKGLEGFAAAMAVRQAPWRWKFQSNGILISNGLVVSWGQRPKVFTCGHWDTGIGIISWVCGNVGLLPVYFIIGLTSQDILTNKAWTEEMTIWCEDEMMQIILKIYYSILDYADVMI